MRDLMAGWGCRPGGRGYEPAPPAGQIGRLERVMIPDAPLPPTSPTQDRAPHRSQVDPALLRGERRRPAASEYVIIGTLCDFAWSDRRRLCKPMPLLAALPGAPDRAW